MKLARMMVTDSVNGMTKKISAMMKRLKRILSARKKAQRTSVLPKR